MTLLAAFQTLLYRYTGQTNIVVGTDVANRTHVETEALIGFFINLLALRIDLSGSPIFRNVLHRVREMVVGAYMHQELPFEMLVERLRLERRTNQIPLVQVLFVLQNTPRPSGKLPGVIFESANNGVTMSKFDLALFMQEASHGIGGVVTYSTDLFEERTIATLISRFEVLLHNIVANPATSVDMFDIYTDAEKVGQLKEKQGRRKFTARNLKAVKGKEIDVL